MKKVMILTSAVVLAFASTLTFATEVPPVSALQLTGKTSTKDLFWTTYLRDVSDEYKTAGWSIADRNNYTYDEKSLSSNLKVKIVLNDNKLTSHYHVDKYHSLITIKQNLSNEEIARIKANKKFLYKEHKAEFCATPEFGCNPAYTTYSCKTTADDLEKCSW